MNKRLLIWFLKIAKQYSKITSKLDFHNNFIEFSLKKSNQKGF